MELERKRAFIIRVAYYAILVALVGVAAKVGFSMLTPFLLGFLVAYVLRRPTKFLVERLHLPYKPAALAMVLLFYCTVGTLIVLVVIRAVAGMGELLLLLPHLYTEHIEVMLRDIFTWIGGLLEGMDQSLLTLLQEFAVQFMSWAGTFVTRMSGMAVSAASGLAGAIPGLFIKVVLLLISSLFIAADYEELAGFCMRQMSSRGEELFYQIKNYLVGTLFVCIGSYAIIVTLTFMELSVGLTVIGVRHPFLIAFCIAIFDILPVLGTGGIMIPWAVISFLRGNTQLGISLLVLYVIITIIRNIVEPKIVGSQLGLHPVVTLSSMFLGVQLFGVVGMFGFPIGLSLLRYLNDQGTIKLFKS